MRSPRRFGVLIPLALVFVLAVAACGGDDDDDSNASNTTAGGDTTTTVSTEPVTLRLGYFPNVTHAPAIVGVENGDLREDARQQRHARDEDVQRRPGGGRARSSAVSSTPPSSVPNPSINAYQKSNGEKVRIVSGAASGGAYLVVKPEITAADLKGKTIATPQLGNTQDVALRTWLKNKGSRPTPPAAVT